MSSQPAPTRRIDSIDGLRALAFLSVFAFHTWEFAGRPYVPVISSVVGQNIRPDFFVVLTGFVLYLPFARDGSRLDSFATRSYLTRRLRRIVLPYYAALAFAVALPQGLVILMRLLGRDASWQPWPSAGDLVSHLTFTHLFFVDHWDGINGSLWTMSLEMQLYLLFPLLVLAIHRWGVRALLGAIVVAVLFRVGVAVAVDGPRFPDEFLWGASGLGRLMEFAAGMGAAVLAFRARPDLGRLRTAGLALGALCSYWVATARWPISEVLPLRELGLGALFAAVVILTLRTGLSRVVSVLPLRWVGLRAYSLFLVHQPVAWYLSEAMTKFGGLEQGTGLLAVLWTVGLVVVVAVGLVLWLTVEQPCIRWARAVPQRRPAPLDAVGAESRPRQGEPA
ncbi:acyltransferase [Intrasporangium calvum]|uniref:Acyltransferase n=1 Tax=Intrasporangium calvum TaxID=53358 RepID=A0ABT5GKK4_9MICO|nr:acyltransferase [Intrasporangium calvum]MDC5698425.1 acyltransferase [Intrasporangium calvum]